MRRLSRCLRWRWRWLRLVIFPPKIWRIVSGEHAGAAIALGMNMVILTGQIDISVGSVFAVSGIVAGVLSKLGMPVVVAGLARLLQAPPWGRLIRACGVGANSFDCGYACDDGGAARRVRWATQGAWVSDLLLGFQWLGLSQSSYPVLIAGTAVASVAAIGWDCGIWPEGARCMRLVRMRKRRDWLGSIRT